MHSLNRILAATEGNSKANTRIMQLMLAKDFAESGWNRFVNHRRKQINKRKFFVSIDEYDDMYEKIQSLMINTLDPEDRKSLVAELKREYNDTTERNEYAVLLSYDGGFATHLSIGSYDVPVKVTREVEGQEETTKASKQNNNSSGSFWEDFLDNAVPDVDGKPEKDMYGRVTYATRIVFTCSSVEMRDAVLDWLDERALEFDKDKPKSRFYVSTSAGQWAYRSVLPGRAMHTVVLPRGDKERVTSDVQRFIASRSRYNDLGVPWHRGYLFHGPPGTGKTSLASAIATLLNSNVYFIQLSSLSDDTKLQDLVNSMDVTRAVLLIEDVDIAHAATSRDDTTRGVTLQGLLNVLDGIGTPDGLVTILTTNRRSLLEDALVRPGRVDFEMEIGYVTDEQMRMLIETFHHEPIEVPEITGNITAADIVGMFKDETDTETLRHRLTEFIETKNKEL